MMTVQERNKQYVCKLKNNNNNTNIYRLRFLSASFPFFTQERILLDLTPFFY